MNLARRALVALMAFGLVVMTGFSGVALASQDDLGVKYCGDVIARYGLVDSGEPERVVGPKAVVIKLEGVISTASKEYVEAAIEYAESKGYPLIVELNTPGGLLDPAMDIVVAISRAEVPVIGYVVERWAESAGTMILVATHVAAMQPGTIIGSLQPVAYNPSTGGYEPINESKIINPILEMLCEHGATRGRNATALARFVLFNDNYGAEEALSYNVIDLIAASEAELLSKLDGAKVSLPAGYIVEMRLDGTYEVFEPSIRIRVLMLLSDPTLSGLLLSIGALALLFSIVSGNPAGIAIGAFLVLLGLLGSGFNPNTAALMLLLGGALLVFIELYTPGFGILGGTGIAMLVIGLALMPAAESFALSESYVDQVLQTLYAIGGLMGVFTAIVIYKVVQARKRRPSLWSIERSIGIALDDIGPDKEGFVLVEGEYWKAVGKEEIRKGSEIVVVAKKGSLLIVEPRRKDQDMSGSVYGKEQSDNE